MLLLGLIYILLSLGNKGQQSAASSPTQSRTCTDHPRKRSPFVHLDKEIMAEQSFTALKELSEQLTCGICLNQYTTPKTLQCLHSFCLKCIEKLPQQPQVSTHKHTYTHVLNIYIYNKLYY